MTKIQDSSVFRALWEGPVSTEQIAELYGVTRSGVSQAAKRFGLKSRIDRQGPPPCPVTIRGQKFPSQTAAARHFGVSPAWVNRLLDQGRIDDLGLSSPTGNSQRPSDHREAGAACDGQKKDPFSVSNGAAQPQGRGASLPAPATKGAAE